MAFPHPGIQGMPFVEYLDIFTRVPLRGGDKFNAAMQMLMVVPVYEVFHPDACCSQVLKAF